ncbi:CCC motif membrane protein [Aestuariibaculum sediminum]|uniref:DUF4190 domain-containing protein n=1 Tax=Aestuariibaculum sediminum TaxID=2770637 RepID=A0A8J6Q259_9FLAO|nr:CCC motif membrane protein [Aestuariibaculum sediminum]MBD0831776.1 DUF4190 domain-containing protein [Aestuariibaculum sediminum]
MEKQNLPNSTLVLVLGILSILGCCFYGIPGLILAIVGLIFASKATKLYQSNPDLYEGYGNVKAGKIMAIISLVLSIIFILLIVWAIVYFGFETLQNEELLRERLEELQQS